MGIAVLALVASASGQGGVLFTTRVFNLVVAPVYGPEVGDPTLTKTGNTSAGYPAGAQIYTGPLLEGTGYTAELWAGPEGAQECELVALARTSFRTNPLAGFVLSPASPVTVPFALPGARVQFQLRAWDNQSGAVVSWLQAQCGGGAYGSSPMLLSDPLGTVGAPSFLRGLQSFNLHFTPGIAYQMFLTLGGCEFIPTGPVTVFQGENVTLALRCPQTGAFLQWTRSGVSVAGANTAILSLPNIQPSQAGTYAVIDTDPPPGVEPPAISLRVVPRPRLDVPRVTAQGAFAMNLIGVTNRWVAIEVSSNLVTWTPWKTNYPFGSPAPVQYPPPLPKPARFFRARPLPTPP